MRSKGIVGRSLVFMIAFAVALAGPVAASQAAPPAVITGSASAVTSTGATLNGSITPNGADATFQFQYAPTTSYGSSTPAQQVGGVSAVPVSAAVTGLMPGTTYYFRLTGTNQDGTAFGADMTFTTLSTSSGGTGGAGATGTYVPPKPHLHSSINGRKHTAKFSFRDQGATGFQCALVRFRPGHPKHPKPRFGRCRSPKLYEKLSGKYEFFVRGKDGAGPGRAATFTFQI